MEEDISIQHQMKNLPQHITVYGGKFLSDLQRLHDDEVFWDSNGLTTEGLEWVEDMEQKIESGEYGQGDS